MYGTHLLKLSPPAAGASATMIGDYLTQSGRDARGDLRLLRDLGLTEAAELPPDALPHAFFAMSGAAGLIFAVDANCRRLTGLDPKKPEAIEAHADFVANLIVPLDRLG